MSLLKMESKFLHALKQMEHQTQQTDVKSTSHVREQELLNLEHMPQVLEGDMSLKKKTE